MATCQRELHKWGGANQVSFDAAKESRRILSLADPPGDNFKMLGIIFDGAFTMEHTVAEAVAETGWKLRTLLRTKRYYTDAKLIVLYKTKFFKFHRV